ncbi:MAG: alpha/beta hydrolase domain-containing protein [Actinomycetota bacterium]
MRASVRTLTAIALLAGLLVPGPAHAGVPNPTVEGPITAGLHGRPWFSSLVDLEPYGYTEEEFFFSGEAEGLPYKTRMVVRRPVEAADFSGTVYVEWVNVTGGRDLETLWPAGHTTILDEGHAYVVVSAQLVGHSELRAWDPVRYGSLMHPGDSPGSFRIYEQAIQAIRNPKKVAPLGPLAADYVIATGDSQSAGRLTTYIEEGYAIEGLIDGFLPGRGGATKKTGTVAEKLRVPMLWILEESQEERPGDTAWQKFWYQAGAAHAPQDWNHYVWRSDMRDLGQNAPVPNGVNAGCSVNRGDGYAVRGGIHWINRWVRGLDRPGGRAADFMPPTSPRLKRDDEGELVRDEDGHAIGGIRYPYIEAPIGVNSSEGCPLFGTYEPFTSAEILDRYPQRDDYIAAVKKAADAAVDAGFLLPSDRGLIMTEAKTFDVWSPGSALCYDLAQPVERLYYESPIVPCPGG